MEEKAEVSVGNERNRIGMSSVRSYENSMDINEKQKKSFENLIIKCNDFMKSLEYFQTNLSKNAKELDIIIENHFSDLSLVVRTKLIMNILQALTSNIRYRYLLYGAFNSGKSSFLNSMIGYDLLNNSNQPTTQVILVLRHHDKDEPVLYKGDMESNPCYEFVEKEVLAVGSIEIKNKLDELDKITTRKDTSGHKQWIKNNCYILYCRLSYFSKFQIDPRILSRFELIDLPGQGEIGNEYVLDTLNYFLNSDKLAWDVFIERIFQIIAEDLEKNFEISHDPEFRSMPIKYLKNLVGVDSLNSNYQNFRNNSCIFLIPYDGIASSINLQILSHIQKNERSFQNKLYILNKSDLITSKSILNLISNIKKTIELDPNSDNETKVAEIECLDDYAMKFKDTNIKPLEKQSKMKEFVMDYISINFKLFGDKNKQIISAFSALINRISKSQILSQDAKLKFYEEVYNSTPGFNSLESFEEFLDKIVTITNKTNQFEEEFTRCEHIVFYNLLSSFYNDGNKQLLAYNNLQVMITDSLKIQTSDFTFEFKSKVDVDLFKQSVETTIKSFTDEYLFIMQNIPGEFEEDFNRSIVKTKQSIDEWKDSIFIHTSGKINELAEKYKALFAHINLALQSFMHEVQGHDLKLIIDIKSKLKELGYLNEYIANYLSNIEITINEKLVLFEENYDSFVTELLTVVGITGGVGIASGIVGFGVSRLISGVASFAGPIGVAVGILFGLGSLAGTTIYNNTKNKKLFEEKYTEFNLLVDQFNGLMLTKIKAFIEANRAEILLRLKRLRNYIIFILDSKICI